jgi:hypothetical protein
MERLVARLPLQHQITGMSRSLLKFGGDPELAQAT